MDFYSRYELIEPVPGTGTKSFRARQVSTARDVTVHLLVGGRTPENEQLLARLRGMPAQSFSKLIEVGDNEGTPFVVTVAPPYLHLADWLGEQEIAAAQGVQRPTAGGARRTPTAYGNMPAPLETASPATPASPPTAPRGTTSGAPVTQSSAPPPQAPASPPASPTSQSSAPGASEPGEFTRMPSSEKLTATEPSSESGS